VNPYLPAALAALCTLVALRGWALLRADTTPAGLEVGEVVQRGKAQGPSATSRLMEALGRPFLSTMRGLYGPKRLETTRRKLGAAGRPDGLTVDRYLAKKAGFIVVCSTAALFMWLNGSRVLTVVIHLVGLGWTDFWLYSEIQQRQAKIERQLPDFLDVLAVTVGAGLSFRAGMARVGASVGGPLGEEILTSLRMMDVGASRRAALEDLRARNLSPSLAQFVGSLLQAEELGAPLSGTLVELATEMRRNWAQQARRRAARTAPQVSLVVTMIFVPGTVILVAVGMYLGSDINFGGFFGG
jgi:tight adherence protein C